MFWTLLMIWFVSLLFCWVLYWLGDEVGANWVETLQDYEPLDVVICTVPVINTLFFIFLVAATFWKLLRLSIFNTSFYSQAWEIIKEIWKN
jgi:hypothetical protein